METQTIEQEITLTARDRCDNKDCGSQAYIHVIGVTGSLMFCGHHYEKIMSNPAGYDAMMKFGYQFIDERFRLQENRLKD